MRKSATENGRFVPIVLGLLLTFAPMVLAGCKKKSETQETQVAVEPHLTETSSASKSLESSDQIDTAGPSERIDLRILYAGLLKTDRAKDFVAFLAAHFEKVETTDYLTFREAESAGCDVTIIDYDGVEFDASKALFKLSPQYTHAAITVGVPGAKICSQLSLKTAFL